jgi:hypothetical protein
MMIEKTQKKLPYLSLQPSLLYLSVKFLVVVLLTVLSSWCSSDALLQQQPYSRSQASLHILYISNRASINVGKGDALGYQLFTKKPQNGEANLKPPALQRPEEVKQEEKKEMEGTKAAATALSTSTTTSQANTDFTSTKDKFKSISNNAAFYSMLATTQSTQTTPPPDYFTPKSNLADYLLPPNNSPQQQRRPQKGVISNFPLLLHPGQDASFWETPLEFRQPQRSMMIPAINKSTSPSSTSSSSSSSSSSLSMENNANRMMMVEAQRDYKLIMGLQHTTSMTGGVNTCNDSGDTEATATEQNWNDNSPADNSTPDSTTATTATTTTSTPATLALTLPKTNPFYQMRTKRFSASESTTTSLPFVNKAVEAVTSSSSNSNNDSTTFAVTTTTTPTTSYVRPYQATNNLLFPDRDMEDLLDRTK